MPSEEREQNGGERNRGMRPGARYSTLVGIAFLVLVVVATVNTFQTDEGELLGIDEVRGQPLAQFAVPDVRGPLAGDANVAQDDCETAENPCPPDRARSPACEIGEQGAIRICDLFDRPLVISFWFTRGAECLGTQDVVDRLARRYSDRVNFLSLNIRDEREEVERIVDERAWSIPVGWDGDGAVSNILRVGVCPTVAFAYPGGILHSATAGEVSALQTRKAVEKLLRDSERRGPAPATAAGVEQ